MLPLFPQILLALLLLTCLTSFTWAVRNFFVRPERMTAGLRVTLLAGLAFACLHLVVIFLTSEFFMPLVYLAAALYCLAMIIFWWAIAANRVKPLSACFTQDEQLHLVQTGPYRLVRHPFYCAYLLTWLAAGVATRSIWLALSFLVMFVLYRTAALNEESKFSRSSLADAYEEYRRSTGRFLPRPLKLMNSRRLH